VATTLSAVLSAFCHILTNMAKIYQGIQSLIYFKYNITAATAISAVGTSCRYE
jgi:hypothetical protein